MNKAFFVLTATLALCLASNVRATGLERLFSVTATQGATEQSDARPVRENPREGASVRVNCKEIDVELDEGYGVSRHETRYVCEPYP